MPYLNDADVMKLRAPLCDVCRLRRKRKGRDKCDKCSFSPESWARAQSKAHMHQRNRYNRQKKSGLCPKCSTPVTLPRVYCSECVAKIHPPNPRKPRILVFCAGCKKLLQNGRSKTGLCRDCFRPPWTIERWIQQGRLYHQLDGGKENRPNKKARKDAARSFLAKEQHGRCKFCTMPISISDAHLDHDHTTDITRGLVHKLCNHLIGVLEAAIRLGSPLPTIPKIAAGFYKYLNLNPLP